MIFQDKVVLITGGTGSLGKALVRRILVGDHGRPRRVIVFSRDEDKQFQMRLEWKELAAATDDIMYRGANGILDFVIGDVRDYRAISNSVKDANIVIHAAALKQVPACEYFPRESISTNISGIDNVLRAVQERGVGVETVLSVSTDKACKPVNVYGMCKAIQERLTVEANLHRPGVRFICTRYGNVAGSRGSAIRLFQEQIRNGGPITVTDGRMTRFLLTLDQAVTTIFDAVRLADPGDIFVPDLTSARVSDLVDVMAESSRVAVKAIGVRPGEKMHEILITEEEIPRTVQIGRYYVVRPILPELQRKSIDSTLVHELTSADKAMGKEELRRFLEQEGFLGASRL